MTPKEKAKELISKFTFLSFPESDSKFYNPKQCASIAIDEIINIELRNFEMEIYSELYFWKEVNEEIKKL